MLFLRHAGIRNKNRIKHYIQKVLDKEKKNIIASTNLQSCSEISDSKCFEDDEILYLFNPKLICDRNLNQNEKKF